MQSRRTFIGSIIAAIAGCFAGIPKLFGMSEPIYGPSRMEAVRGTWLTQEQCDPIGDIRRVQLEAKNSGKFGHWICGRDAGFNDIRLDDFWVAAVEANDTEGWAIIDICDFRKQASDGNPSMSFHGNWPQAKVFGRVVISPGETGCGYLDQDHQAALLNKHSTIFLRPRCGDFPGCVPYTDHAYPAMPHPDYDYIGKNSAKDIS